MPTKFRNPKLSGTLGLRPVSPVRTAFVVSANAVSGDPGRLPGTNPAKTGSDYFGIADHPFRNTPLVFHNAVSGSLRKVAVP